MKQFLMKHPFFALLMIESLVDAYIASLEIIFLRKKGKFKGRGKQLCSDMSDVGFAVAEKIGERVKKEQSRTIGFKAS